MQAGENDKVEQVSKSKSVELFNLKKTTEGITKTIEDFIPDLEQGIVQVDNSMTSIINQMGQGKGLAEGIKEEYAQAAIEVLKMGGTQEQALEIQTKTLDVLGRNVVLSSDQTKELFAAQQVSGVQIDVLEKAFINAGKSIKDIGKEMLMVREVANNMGVNAKAVSALVVQNLDKLNRYGFQNGVEGLAKMAASSQALGIDMTETLDLADELMSPEKAMEISAMFQRLGSSSAALTNPLKLMDLSMNDTAKLQEELGDYFKSFAKFNEKTGQFEIAKSERLKIKQLAQELGISREQIEKMALAGADLDKKLSKISFAGFNIDEETQQMVANMAIMGDKGEYVIKTKDESGKLIEQSIQDFLSSTKGDKEAIKAALGATEEAATKRPIEEIATDQLSALSKIQAGIETLEKSPGLTAGASKLGTDLLKANQVLADSINQSFGKQFQTKDEKGQPTDYQKSLDEFGTTLEKAVEEAKKPNADFSKIGKDLLEAGVDFSKGLGGVVAKGGAEALYNLGDVTGAQQILEDKNIDEKIRLKFKELQDKLPQKEEEKSGFNIPEGAFNIDEQNVKNLNLDGDFNIGGNFNIDKEVEIDQLGADKVVLGQGVEALIDGQVDEIKKIGEGVTETNNELIQSQEKLSDAVNEQSSSQEEKEIKIVTEPTPEPTVTQPTIINQPTEEKITPIKTETPQKGEGLEFNIEDAKPTGFIPQVGPALAQVGGTEGMNINEFINLDKILQPKSVENVSTEESTLKSFVENNTKELQNSNKTLSIDFKSELEKIKDTKTLTDNTETVKISDNSENLSKEIIKSSEKNFEKFDIRTGKIVQGPEFNRFENFLNENQKGVEKLNIEKTTTDNTETIKLGNNVENIFTKFENQSDSVKSVLEKNSKSTDIFTELANTNKTILEKTKDEGTNVNTSILNENTDTFINKINEGVEIANKTEEKNNQLSEIQNTITDKDFEKRVLMSESIIRDLDIAKKQLEINTENALLTENEQLNIERLSDTKQSDFEKRVTESEELIKFLDRQIEKQKGIEISSTNVNESLNEQISKIAESNKDFTTISKTNEASKTTETNVVNPSPIQLTDLSVGDTNFKGLDIKIQDFLSKQTEQNNTATTSSEPLKIETKLTIDGDPRFASLLDPRQLQRTVEDVMTKSIGKPQFAQKISTGTQNASMGMTSKS